MPRILPKIAIHTQKDVYVFYRLWKGILNGIKTEYKGDK